MILSVVIVSYQVKFFLEQCLSSLKKAVEGSTELRSQTEIIIVDNASTDGSIEFLRPLYPSFRFIQNKENSGFAKANNQSLFLCTGQFILFLNPDTILAENSLDDCLSFFRSHPDAGALGIQMVDGTGRFLRESKRGFPEPAAAFYKMAGLAGLFPRSSVFSAYYQGHLDKDHSHPVDILSGAFMMVKREVLDITGGFDEQFFMYAEDIDLSWRIRQAGFQNYYFAGTSIVHFKGESTPRDIRYVKMFYEAMDLFMKKHFGKNGSSMPLFFLRLGMRIHEGFAFLRIPFKTSVLRVSPRTTVFLKGDPSSAAVCRQKLEALNIRISESEGDAGEIICCEGPLWSWKSIIAELIKNGREHRSIFHGASTHAAVGSYSSRDQGEVLQL